MSEMSEMPECILLPALSASVAELDARATGTFCSPYHLTEQILKLSSWYIELSKKKTLFGKYTVDPYTPSLETLFNRLHDKQLAPSLLPSGFIHVDRLNERSELRVEGEAAERPLYEYEDLFYALNARMQEMHQLLNLRLHSGFNTITDEVYEGGPNIVLFHEKLSNHWTSLNKSSCGKALDNAVREARVMALRQELVWQMDNDQITRADAEIMGVKLYCPEVFDNVTGLTYILDWAPIMVGAYLEAKYRRMLDHEQQEAAIEERRKRRVARIISMRQALNAGVPNVVSPRSRKSSTRRKSATRNKNSTRSKSATRRESSTSRVCLGPPKTFYGETCYPDKYLASLQTIPSPTTFNMQYAKDQATMQNSPECTAQLHAGSHHQEHSAVIFDVEAEEKLEYERQERAIVERQIAEEREAREDLEMMLAWKAKMERVLEYSDYLRANASADAKYAVQSTRVRAVHPSLLGQYNGAPFYKQDIDFEPYGGEW
ncbi:hypothetical protein PtrSN002B_002904 [Pyrenophora tritici-repentis]|uniref:Herpes-BLLF1 domain containing protein n=2 Tax=Pyrenophora tritici-repentis TaxID=45151 RepID=A0A2W1I7M8_9PLEO|nr:uncharacterized protein PTRG_06947 [Pyrenophora tritici-repentis Pt-1C-BFP]KAA8614494.1 hypothetical protein PtrV1_11524 [Pyrenophora tritici-repentis]EDU49867.1 predicted protein [Pyrenophora tritici-repentis Pt-1C-BFP]KAF7444328.1 hypothetical protein A1F99_108810 [Pyrenophora tritici-repentis]KAF7565021.1 Herpes-BLLF1 domain containing protein [Pyrenophora tritici-repentis]KAG9378574.1 hypothetical protein A1F94_010343 [Pyrenophora tritici-repentis]